MLFLLFFSSFLWFLFFLYKHRHSGFFLKSLPVAVLFLQAVLSAHDTVAQKNFDPVLPPLPEDLDDDLEEESVKIVRLVKNKEPLVRVSSDLKTTQHLL